MTRTLPCRTASKGGAWHAFVAKARLSDRLGASRRKDFIKLIDSPCMEQ